MQAGGELLSARRAGKALSAKHSRFHVARAMPGRPVLGRGSLHRSSGRVTSVFDAGQFVLTRSGRSALVLALQSLGVGAGCSVLVPNYYCATMPGAVEYAGAAPVFYPIDERGLPNLDWIRVRGAKCRAILATHFFGLPLDLSDVRRFCDDSGLFLIEDCAHAFFGGIGVHSVGSFGHCAIASLPKFFPVIEGGLLVGSEAQLAKCSHLTRPGMLAELKGIWNMLEVAAEASDVVPFRAAIGFASAVLTSVRGRSCAETSVIGGYTAPEVVRAATLADPLLVPMRLRRVEQWLIDLVAPDRIVTQRRKNYLHLAQAIEQRPGVRPVLADVAVAAVPYAFPLWVERADAVYAELRAQLLPVLRWDTYWPGAIDAPDDVGRQWADHVLQILCHQDLTLSDMEVIARAVSDSARRAELI